MDVLITPEFRRAADTAAGWGLELSERILRQMEAYARLMLEKNEAINLTAITSWEGVAVKHFLDSLALIPVIREHYGTGLPERIKLCDMGSGAGFPGVPLKLSLGDAEVTLVDSTMKRVAFLREACASVGAEVEAVHMRGEEAGRNPRYRERFDIVTARAVAALPELCEYCLPLVRRGGVFIAMKGPDCSEEVSAAASAVKLLGGAFVRTAEYTLPAFGGESAASRTVVVIAKVSSTPGEYPRPTAKIAKGAIR